MDCSCYNDNKWLYMNDVMVIYDSDKFSIDSDMYSIDSDNDDIDHNIGYDGVDVDNSDYTSYFNDKLNI